MTTDLTFFTNEEGRTLVDRFKDLIGDDTRAFGININFSFIHTFCLRSICREKIYNLFNADNI